MNRFKVALHEPQFAVAISMMSFILFLQFRVRCSDLVASGAALDTFNPGSNVKLMLRPRLE